MKNVRIGFSKPRGSFNPFSWLIRLVCRTPYSHVYCSHLSEKYGSTLIYQASGVQVNFMSKQQFDKRAFVVSEFEFEITEERFSDYMKWAIEQSGAPYSFIKLFEIAFNINIRTSSEPEWVCSVLAAKICKDYLDDSINNIEYKTPKDIFNFCSASGRRLL